MNTPTLWIYQAGAMTAQTTVTTHADGTQRADFSGQITGWDNGRAISTPDKLATDYVAELNAKREPGSPEFQIYTYEDFKAVQRSSVDLKLVGPWDEITEERWDEMLNVLPPQKWRTVGGVNIFRMCEYYTDNITSHFAKIQTPTGLRFFTAHRRTTADYADLAALGPYPWRWQLHNAAGRLVAGGYDATEAEAIAAAQIMKNAL